MDCKDDAIRLLEDLGHRSTEEPCRGGAPEGGVSHFHPLNLNELSLAAQALAEIVDFVFENLFFELPWPQIERTLDGVTQYLRLVDRKLEEKLYWLGEILEDLGNVMALDGEVATSEDDTEPLICLDKFRI